MSTKSTVAAVLLLALLGAGIFFFAGDARTPSDRLGGSENEQVYCTADAMLCPDGTYVGRTGPDCEFVCPVDATGTTTSGASGSSPVMLSGRVTLSPTCPVERTPPDPLCAPKAYSTTVEVRKSGQVALFASTETDKNGAFTVKLAPGTYDVIAIGKNPYPRCESKTITVSGSGTISPLELSCDTGIR